MSPLTWILGLPLAMAVGLAFVPSRKQRLIRILTLGVTGLIAVMAIHMGLGYDAALVEGGGYRFVQRIPWVESVGISFAVGVDGINLGLVILATVVAFAAACVSSEIQERIKEFHILLLVMTGGLVGAFASLDIFFLYVFHEFALVPTFVMIWVWGRGEKRSYAAFQITIYLTIGALIALIGLIALYLQAGIQSFDLVTLTEHFATNPLPVARQNFIFPWLMFGLGILVSLWPFHTWAPLGYGVAPTATAMLHAGVLKKFGLYVLLKVAIPLLPEGARTWLPLLAWLCLGNILYCGWVAMRQRDLNLLIGNSSVAHVGFVFLGLASLTVVGLTGAVVVMIAHGFLAALSFALSGWLYGQTRSLDMPSMGGLLARLPFVGTIMIMAMMAGCGLPGFGNFVGEVLVLFGAWKSELTVSSNGMPLRWLVVFAAWGAVVVAAIYMLRGIRLVWHGPASGKWDRALDPMGAWRRFPFVLLLMALVVIGCWPRLLTDRIEPATRAIAEAVASSRPVPNLAVTSTPP